MQGAGRARGRGRGQPPTIAPSIGQRDELAGEVGFINLSSLLWLDAIIQMSFLFFGFLASSSS